MHASIKKIVNHADHELNENVLAYDWFEKEWSKLWVRIMTKGECTQVCNFCTNVWNICTRVVKQCTKVIENVPKCVKMYQSVWKCTRVCVLYQSVCFCTKVCVFVPKCDFMSKNYNFSVAYWFSQYSCVPMKKTNVVKKNMCTREHQALKIIHNYS